VVYSLAPTACLSQQHPTVGAVDLGHQGGFRADRYGKLKVERVEHVAHAVGIRVFGAKTGERGAHRRS